jgi:vancomycin permeability regulator SanA
VRKKIRIVSVVVALLLLPLVVAISALLLDGFTDDLFKADAALVLGNSVFPDGTLSPRLRGRVERGMELYKSGLVSKIVVSGGFGKEGHYEGTAMAAWLVANGVPEQDVVIDNEGINTAASAKNFAAISNAHGFESVIVVSQFFHISRCRLALKQVGIERVGTAHSRVYGGRDVYATMREVVAYGKYWMLH